MKEKVKRVLDEKIRPFLRTDGGDCELVDVTKDAVVKIRLTLACAGCPMASMTLKNGIEKKLKEEIPGIKEVQAVQ